jgi:LuxR family transcriptional regulator, maltose regulon positive regulatory protein
VLLEPGRLAACSGTLCRASGAKQTPTMGAFVELSSPAWCERVLAIPEASCGVYAGGRGHPRWGTNGRAADGLADSCSMGGQGSTEDLLAAGWDALRAGGWREARGCFEASLAGAESPEAFEGLGWAAYCLDDDPLTFEARERAFRLYRQQGDDQSAARVAAWLAADWLEFRGEPAVANGWLQRAHRLLDGRELGPAHGWLAAHEASIVVDEDTATARRLAAQAVELGRRFGVPELEMVGLGLEGAALVSEGELAEGMRRLDEATAAALSGEAEILVCSAWTCCYLISACEQVGDYERASDWCRRVGEFCERRGIALLLSVCRAKYAGVLTWQGRWAEAEDEFSRAEQGLAQSRPPLVRHALIRRGELRRRQGRLDEAEALFNRCEGDPFALLGRARVAFDRHRSEDAAEFADRFLRRFPDRNRIERCAGLEVAVSALLALGEPDQAEAALAELMELATRAGTRPLRVAVLAAQGRIEAAQGNLDAARCSFEDALDVLPATGAPFEMARVRLELAGVLDAAHRRDAARREVEAALSAFRQLGAQVEQARAEALRARLSRRPGPAGFDAGPLDRLSPRERDVLVLVSEGLTNRDIAHRLVVSEHTVHRHVTSILRKLGLPSRAAAATLAARHGLT